MSSDILDAIVDCPLPQDCDCPLPQDCDRPLPPTLNPAAMIEPIADVEAVAVIAALEPADRVKSPWEASRTICRSDTGHLFLAEVRNLQASRIGPEIRLSDAAQLAHTVLEGASHAFQAPMVVHQLAVALLASLAQTERVRAATSGHKPEPVVLRFPAPGGSS